jgi:hypothetical protein
MSALQNLATEDLITELVRRSMQNTKEMNTDFLMDPEILKSDGFPTKEKIVQQAVDYMVHTLPDMMFDETDKQFVREEDSKATSFEQLLLCTARRLAEQHPSLITFTIRAR